MLAIFLLAVGALAADSEAPVISLDLQNKHCSSPNSVHPGHDCTSLLAHNHPYVKAAHGKGAVANPLSKGSDYAAARTFADIAVYPDCFDKATGNTKAKCGFKKQPKIPTASAIDHHQKSKIQVQTTITLFTEQASCADHTMCSESNLLSSPGTEVKDWKKETLVRGQYVVDYSAEDASGNQAERVLFALIVSDRTAPTVTMSQTSMEYGPKEQPVQFTITDNFDLSPTGPRSHTFKTCNYRSLKTSDSFNVVTHDFAGIFGTNNQNNAITRRMTISITDTTAPKIDVMKFNLPPGNYSCSDVKPKGVRNNQPKVWKYSDPNIAKGCYGAHQSHKGYFTELQKVVSQKGNFCNKIKGDGKYTYNYADNCKMTYKVKDVSGNISPAKTFEWNVYDDTPPVLHQEQYAPAPDKLHHQDFSFAQKHKDDKVGGHVMIHRRHEGGRQDLDIQVNEDQVSTPAGLQALDNYLLGSWCTDSCKSDGKKFTTGGATGYSWRSSCSDDAVTGSQYDFQAHKVGDYFLRFTCEDEHGNSAINCRKIHNVGQKPVVSISCPAQHGANMDYWRNPTAGDNVQGKYVHQQYHHDWATVKDGWCDHLEIEAGAAPQYVDAGASCSDVLGNAGDLDKPSSYMANGKVVVSGDIVQIDTAATYRITYMCTSKDGTQTSLPAVRTVVVYDTERPECTFKDEDGADEPDEQTIEASFPFSYANAVCKDYSRTGAQGNVPMEMFYDKAVGQKMPYQKLGEVNVELTGTYKLTYIATDINGNSVTYKKTVTVEDSLAPQISLDFKDFMEESPSVNGWLIGAVASAVAGVALLAQTATRRQATTVPV